MSKSEERAEGIIAAGEDELNTLLDVPSVFTNKIYASSTPAGMRLTFCEIRGWPGRLAPRASVLLPFPVAKSLIGVLERQLSKVTVVEEAASAPASDE